MFEEQISQEFRLKSINETENSSPEEIKQNELLSRKHKQVCTTLKDIEHVLILASTITGCILVSAFTSLLGITKKKKNYNEIVLLAKTQKIAQKKTQLNSIEVLNFKAAIKSNISQDEFVLMNNVLKEYDDMKKQIKNLKT